jgi:2-methylcitrate dehydratase
MKSITQRIAAFTRNLKYADLPAEAIEQAKRFLLDSLGCAFAATGREDMRSMLRFTEKLGGVPEATVIGYGLRTNAPNAGLMNGLLIRALDFNDIYWVQDPSHPSDLLGIVLAAAEVNACDGRDTRGGLAPCIAHTVRQPLCCWPLVRAQ